MAPMSMPSSSDEVATTAGRRPALSSASICCRCSRLTEPWCARASTAGAPCPIADCAITSAGIGTPGPTSLPVLHVATGAPVATSPEGSEVGSASGDWRASQISLRRAVRRSARRREFTKTKVEWCSAIASTMRSSTWGQIDGVGSRPPLGADAATSPRSGTGTTTERSQVLAAGGFTTWVGRPPARKRATSAAGRTVADRPTRWAGRSSRSSSRSRLSARCAPRLVPARACTSSTMTVSTPRSASRAAEVSSRNNDSGVVIRMSAPWRANRCRSWLEVSPVRTAI